LWLPYLGARGLLLANAVSQTLQTLALAVAVWRMLGGFDARGIALSFVKVLACSALMAAMLAVVQVFRQPPEPTLLSRATSLLEHLIFGALIFVGAARVLDSSELQLAIDLLLRRRPRGELVPRA
jgi:peptidoglycan biosynthesis protein MviN/MurJ (putative lipid II flippase)